MRRLQPLILYSGWADFIRASQHARSFVKKRIELNKNNIRAIKEHKQTRRLLYDEYPLAFDYVANLYPAIDIRAAMVFYSPSAIVSYFGFPGVGGFYDVGSQIVVITDCLDDYEAKYKAEFTVDEVLCHELIHYCANFKKPLSSRELEEEIAYGHSIKYLQLIKKHSDEFIIRKNLFPYLISVVNRSKVYQKVLPTLYSQQALAKASEESIKILATQHKAEIQKGIENEAYDLGLNMIRIYGVEQFDICKKEPSKVILDIDSEL